MSYFIIRSMSPFNESECADVNGECRYIDEMGISHFVTISSCFSVIVIECFGDLIL